MVLCVARTGWHALVIDFVRLGSRRFRCADVLFGGSDAPYRCRGLAGGCAGGCGTGSSDLSRFFRSGVRCAYVLIAVGALFRTPVLGAGGTLLGSNRPACDQRRENDREDYRREQKCSIRCLPACRKITRLIRRTDHRVSPLFVAPDTGGNITEGTSPRHVRWRKFIAPSGMNE